jgi:hypothetical protein
MDITDPEIVFDEQGVCNHCYSYEERANRELLDPSERQERFTTVGGANQTGWQRQGI